MARHFSPPFSDYKSADKFLNGRDQKRVSGNTILERIAVDSGLDAIALRLHNTQIVTYFSDGAIEINTGGYLTNTTKRYINGSAPVHVSQKDFQWYVNGKKWDGSRLMVK